MANLMTFDDGNGGVDRFLDMLINSMQNRMDSRIDSRVDNKLAPYIERQDTLAARVQNLEGMMEREGLTRSQEYEIKRQVGVLAYKYEKLDDKTLRQHFCNIWGGLKDKFNVSKYTQIPRNRYDDAVSTVRHYDGTSKDYWMDYVR